MAYKVNPLSFGNIENQQPSSGFQYDYGNVQQPEPIQPVQEEINEQGIIADFIDKVQGGAWGAAADIITGTRGLLTDDRVWEMEQYLRDQVTAQEETLSQAQLEADQGGAFESPRGFMGAVASGIGSIAPSMVAGGVAGIGGRALAGKAAQMMGAADKAQNVAETAGQFAGAGMAGAPMIGGAAANQVSEELNVMPNVEFSQLPNFDQYYQTALQENPDDPNSAMTMARDAYTQDAEKTAVRYGAAVGGASMGVAGPYLEKILRGGQGIASGAWLGARTEAAQEGFESGAQQAIVNPLAGRDVGEGVVSAAVEGGVLGGIIGGGVGGTAGGFRGAPGEEIQAPIEEQPQPYVQQGPEEFLQPGAGRQGERPFFEEYVPPTQAEINEGNITTQMQRDLDTESAIARQTQDNIYNDPFIEEPIAQEPVQEEVEQPIQQVQYPMPEKAITKMNPEELQQYSAEINNYAEQIVQAGDPNNEIQAVNEIQRRVGILGETTQEDMWSPENLYPVDEKPALDEIAKEAATSPDNELPEPTEAQLKKAKSSDVIKGRDEKYGIDVELTKTDEGYTLTNSDENATDVVISSGVGGVYQNDNILNLDGELVPNSTIVQGSTGETSPEQTPFKGTPEQNEEAKRLLAEILFNNETGNYDKANALEEELANLVSPFTKKESKKGALAKPGEPSPRVKTAETKKPVTIEKDQPAKKGDLVNLGDNSVQEIVDVKTGEGGFVKIKTVKTRDKDNNWQDYKGRPRKLSIGEFVRLTGIYPASVETEVKADVTRQKEPETVAQRDRDQQLAKDKTEQKAKAAGTAEDGYHTELVKRSYAHSSNSPGRAAKIHKREYEQTVQEVTEAGDKLAKTPEQKEALTQAVDKFKQDYLDHERSLMGVRAGVVSGHIAGRSKFNAKQAGRRSNALDRAQDNFNKWLNTAKNDVERIVQAARTPEAVETDRKEATAKREKSIHTRLMRDIASSLAAMNEPGMDAAAFRPKATKNLKQALEQNEAETLRLMEVINKALKDDGGIEKTVGSRSNFWKIYKAASAEAKAENDIVTGKLLKAISEADTDYLQGITTLTQLEELQKVLARAEYKAPDELKDKDSMSRKTLKEDVTLNDYIQYAEFPNPIVMRDGLQSLANDLEDIPGYKALSKSINSVLKRNPDEKINLDNYPKIDQAKIKKYSKLPGVYGSSQWIADYIQSSERLEKIGITSLPHLRMALRELNAIQEKVAGVSPEQKKAKELKRMERELVGKKMPGFFPTPEPIVQDLISDADIQKGDKVLEPSAGKGDIADALKEQGADVYAVEMQPNLRDILESKGHNVVGNDFLEITDKYDKIIMNPPFENFQDIDHVMKAYELLNPDGRVVAVMGAGVNNTRKKATEFRAWVEEKGGTIEELPEGSFKSAFRPTGVNTVKVIIDKPAAKPVVKKAPVKKTGTDYSKPGKAKQPVTHPDFSFTGMSKPAGLSERQIFNIINDKYGRPMFGASKFKNVDIINDPAKKWRGTYKDGQIVLNAYYMTKDDAVRILQHEKVHEYIKQDPEFRKIAKDILRRAERNPNSAAGKALEIAKQRVPKDSKDYNRKIFEETMAYLVQYYNKPEVQGIFKRLAAAVAKFFRGKLGIKMNEDDAVTYLKDMVKAEAVGVETEQKAYKQEMADIMAGADVEEIEYSALGDVAGNITDRMTAGFESDFMDTMKSKINSQKWGVLNVRQIADVLGKYAPEIKNNYIDRFKRFEADMNKMKQDAGDIAMERQDLSKGENEKLAQVQHEATIEGYDPSMGEPDPNDKKGDFALREGIKTDYEQLTPEAKTIYTQERDYHKAMHDARLKALTERINAIEADEGFKESMVEKLHKEFDKAAKDGPYFPLARFGQYWVSSENDQGVKSFDMFENEYSQKRFKEELRSDPNEEVIGSGMKLDNLKSVDGVSGQFIADVDKLIRKGGDSPVTQQIRDDVFQLYLETLPELSARKKYLHRGKVKGFAKDQARAFAQKARADANDVARLRHIHVLQNMIDDTETSLNIASSTKLKRQFSEHVEALQIALEDVPFGITDHEIQELNAGAPFKVFALNETADPEAEIKRVLKKEKMLLENAEKITEDKIIFVANGLNELKKSHEAMVNNEVHPVASNLNSLGFLWYLGASPAAALVNLTQTPTVALPMMLADKSLKNSARYLTGAVKDFIAGKGTIEPTLNAQEKEAFNEWHDSGLLENTQAHDLSGVADSGIDTGTFKNKAMRMISFMFHRAEVMNREVTALATYRAAMAGGATHEQAVKKGADLTWNSHLDYGASNRARFMRGNTMRVITQFKQYSQGITYIYGKTLLDTFKGESKQDRQQAMKLLGMLVSSQIAVAGTLGLPMAGVVMGITQGLKDAFDDDDEATSVKAEFRQAMSDFAGQTGGQAISHGLIDAFTPLSMSGRLSMADLWVRTPDFDQEGKAEALSYIEALGGPMVSIFTNMFMGKDSLRDGNFIRAAEQMTPKVVKDFMRTTRYMTEGNLTKAGLKIKDMTPSEMIAQALGFSSSEVSEIRERSTAIKNIEKKRSTRRKDIINNWMESDNRDMTEIVAWNSTHPGNRITSKTLRAARKSKARYAKQYVKGVRQTRVNKDLLEKYDY